MKLENIADTAISGFVTGGIGNIFSNIAANRQQRQNEELMNHQYKLNQMAAEANQQRAKDIWNYTSYPNQVKKLKEAGLNPALLYGNGGEGGSTAGAGTASGSGLGSVGMALTPQNYMMISEAKLNEAKADEARANAEEKRGETEPAKINMDAIRKQIEKADAEISAQIQSVKESKAREGLLKKQQEVAESERKLKDMETHVQFVTVEEKWAHIDKMIQEVKNLQRAYDAMALDMERAGLDNRYLRETMQDRINLATYTAINMENEGNLTQQKIDNLVSELALNDAKTDSIYEAINRNNAETKAKIDRWALQNKVDLKQFRLNCAKVGIDASLKLLQMAVSLWSRGKLGGLSGGSSAGSTAAAGSSSVGYPMS